MSEHTKKHHTNKVKDSGYASYNAILPLEYKGHIYHIPQSIAKKYEKKFKLENNMLPEDIFENLEEKYTKAGVLLKGVRHREGLSQLEMAKKISVTQADLSKMENGKRPIGKIIAKRIEKIFGVHYRYFL